MAAPKDTARQPGRPLAPVRPLPEQTRRRVALRAEAEPLRWTGPTAVLAHRHAWSVGIVLVGDRLAMMPVDVLLPEVRRFAPDALLAVASSDLQRGGARRAQADEVFFRHQSPRDVADALSALCSDAA